ncbi:MAG: energy-coupling factor transporter transmembrane component T, partial [Oscillospiraceae bacterium]|nr:energy-coupling factor transporter transmembrane component T [Oscillospiraceae bacterium]
MLRDISFGQYLSVPSPVHRLDPRIKILLTVAFIVMLFSTDSPWGIALSLIFCAVLFALAKVPLKMIARSVKPILPIVLFTALLNMFFMSGEELFSIWKITVTREGLYYAVILSLRIICLIAGSSLLTYTTSPIELTDGIERLLSPLKALKLPVHELAMM